MHVNNFHLEINFIYLGNKEIYCTCKTCCINSVLFYTKCHLFHYFIIFCSNNTIFINHVLKIKYQTSHLGVHATQCYTQLVCSQTPFGFSK